MNATLAEASALAQEIRRSAAGVSDLEIVLCPPFTALSKVAEQLKGSRISLGAQDLYWHPQGPYTGEISPTQLKDLGCRFCIVGHSEGRHLLRETDADVQKKLRAGIDQNLTMILCVGETLEEREKGRTWSVIEGQLKGALQGVEPARLSPQVVIAYEPVWAIGTGLNATGLQAEEVHAQIRSWLAGQIGRNGAESIRIQYGGSVKPDNVSELASQPDIDGFLVGGASLTATDFLSIIELARQVKGSQCCTG